MHKIFSFLLMLCFSCTVVAEVLTDTAAEALIDSNGHAEIPTNYTSIAEGAFDGVQALRSLTIPTSITDIGRSAFKDTPYLTSVEIPNSVSAILDNVFAGSGVKSIIIPSSVSYIGWNNFSIGIRECGLEELIIGMKEIPDEAFQSCAALTEVTLLDTVQDIGDNTFEATPITSITLPESLISIGSAAFRQTQLESIIIPDSVVTIKDAAFASVPLKRLILGKSVTSIEQLAFSYTDLTTVLIPENAKGLGYNSFYSQYLMDVYVYGISGQHSWSPNRVFYMNAQVKFCECSLDFDGNTQFDALTDGLLLLRTLFGIDGNSLITGTLAPDALYQASNTIESRISSLGTLTDIDGNGDIDALTDGLLTLRYLFGLEGAVLVDGVLGDGATRSSFEIEAHLKSLMQNLSS